MTALLICWKSAPVLVIITAAVAMGRTLAGNTTTSSSCSPIRFLSYSDVNCTEPIVDDSVSSKELYLQDGQCQFFQDALYQASCVSGNSVDMLVFEACFPTSYIQLHKSYVLNTCLPYYRSTSGNSSGVNSIQSILVSGQCAADNSSCTSASSSLNQPLTTKPTSKPVQDDNKPAATIVLPTPPLPPNSFADTMLDLDLAHEIAYLTGILIYRINTTSDGVSLLPSSYTYHLYKDTGSAEVWIVSTEHTNVTKGKIMVLFRGTDNTRDGDWLVNLNAPKVPYGPDGRKLRATVTVPNVFGVNTTYELKVHQGFNMVMNALYDTVVSVVRPLLDRVSDDGSLYYNNTIHFGGHSLGGARAQIMGTYFAFFHPSVRTHVTTLGAPRQGNFAYKVLVESLPNLSVWRMVNCRDVVPRVPLFQYYHAGHVMWKHCDPESSHYSTVSPDLTGVAEAYYRDSGDVDRGFAKLPLSYVIRHNEPSIIDDHLGVHYMEWLEYARNVATDLETNWTHHFTKVLN